MSSTEGSGGILKERKDSNTGQVENPVSRPKGTRKDKFGTLIDYWQRLSKNIDECIDTRSNIGPMERLFELMRAGADVFVMTRGMRDIRAILIGRLVAFDRYWNLILANATEYKMNQPPKITSNVGPGRRKRRRRRKLRQVEARVLSRNENMDVDSPTSTEMTENASQSTKKDASVQASDPSGHNPPLEPLTEFHEQIFIRGANVVMVRPYEVPTEIAFE